MTHTLREIADILIRSVTGGVNSPDTKYEMEYVEALVPQLREEAMQMEYNGSREQAANGRVEFGWLNPSFTVDVDRSIQDDDLDFLIFALPKPAKHKTMQTITISQTPPDPNYSIAISELHRDYGQNPNYTTIHNLYETEN